MAGIILALKYDEELVKDLQELFTHMIVPENFILVIHKYNRNVLTFQDIERIRKMMRTDSTVDVNYDLLLTMKKYKGWFEVILQVCNDPDVKQTDLAEAFQAIKEQLDERWNKQHTKRKGVVMTSESNLGATAMENQLPPNGGEIIKYEDVKCIMGESMPTFGDPFEKGGRVTHLPVKLSQTSLLTPQAIGVSKSIQPLRQEVIVPDGAEECQFQDYNPATNGSDHHQGQEIETDSGDCHAISHNVDVGPDTFKEINQSASSSASSLPNQSIESPGNSRDNVSDLLRAQYDDPDLDLEPELPPLKQVLSEDVLQKLKPKEKKHQEVINELFYTERAHLRNLKVLDLLFNRPMLQKKGIMAELARAMFPNMEQMISSYVTFVRDIKDRTQSTPVVKEVGDLLLKWFDTDDGERFCKDCAEYCRNQAFALDALKKFRSKEPELQKFLHDAEANSLCRRLKLEELLPSQMHRLREYHILIETLLKYTLSRSEEYRRIERALDRCKHILAYVNQAVKECENYHKLKDIQKKLDRRPLEGLNDPAVAELKNLDLTQHNLIFDSPLTWKLKSHRTIDLHVLLFKDLLVLLQKKNEKYVLKCQNTNVQSARDDKYTHFPVLKLQNLLARTLATDEKSFFVVDKLKAQMYEFTTVSSELRLNNSSHPSQPSSPPLEKICEVTDELSCRPDISDDQHSKATLSPVVSCQQTQPPPQQQQQPSLSSPVPMEQLKTMAAEMNAILSKLAGAINSGQETKQMLRQELERTQLSLDSLKQMKKQMIESGTSPSDKTSRDARGAINSGQETKQMLRQELERTQLSLDSLKQMKKQMTESGTSPSDKTRCHQQWARREADAEAGAGAGSTHPGQPQTDEETDESGTSPSDKKIHTISTAIDTTITIITTTTASISS